MITRCRVLRVGFNWKLVLSRAQASRRFGNAAERFIPNWSRLYTGNSLWLPAVRTNQIHRRGMLLCIDWLIFTEDHRVFSFRVRWSLFFLNCLTPKMKAWSVSPTSLAVPSLAWIFINIAVRISDLAFQVVAVLHPCFMLMLHCWSTYLCFGDTNYSTVIIFWKENATELAICCFTVMLSRYWTDAKTMVWDLKAICHPASME